MGVTAPAARIPASSPVDEGVRRSRQQLDEIAARHADRLVAADEHTERTGRRRLLALGKVCRHIIADLAGDERDGADIGFLHLQVADDREHAVRADGSADIQLARILLQQRDTGILHIAADIALGIRNGQQRPKRGRRP